MSEAHASGHGTDALYDTIGKGYAQLRRADPRIYEQIVRALADAETVVNVGAGTGSYEPVDRHVVAVEPSEEMVRQRPPDAAVVVRGDATMLPFPSDAFDAALAILTIHHWPDPAAGLRELKRVARARVVVLTHFIRSLKDFWLVRDYFPETIDRDLARFPTADEVGDALGAIDIEPVPVPNDCTDGFLACYWARPEAYLDENVRAGMSIFPLLNPTLVADRIDRLEADLASGAWDERNGHLRSLPAHDFGYRLVVANT
jgi:SAM-dependent methyltransferase